MAFALRYLADKGTSALFLGILLGLALPDLAALARPLIAPVVAGLLYFSLLLIDGPSVRAHLRRPALLLLSLAWVLGGSALVVVLLLSQSELPESLESAIVLMACAPPILGSTAIAVLLRLDTALTLVLSIAATLVVPLTLPPLALILLDLELSIGPGQLMLYLGILVGLPFLLAMATRGTVGLARLHRHGREINGMLVLLMLVFAVAIMADAAVVLRSDWGHFLEWTLAGFLANIFLQFITALLFFWCGWRFALTLGLMTGNANMGLLLASLPADSDRDILLYFGLAQLPMYMLPALQKPLYRRLIRSSPG